MDWVNIHLEELVGEVNLSIGDVTVLQGTAFPGKEKWL